MLQTRAGRCPNCDEEVAPEAVVCPNCGHDLSWRAKRGAKSRASSDTVSTPVAKKTPSFLRLFVLFIVAIVLTMLAVTIRGKYSKTESPELEAEHATLVQDAEAFRDDIKSHITDSGAPETPYVIGIAMPNGRDVLEITVRNDWKSLDYPTRLSYAAKLAERWKTIHAPHRANLTLLDEAGNEIGGRNWQGTVWVQEKHEDAPAPRPTVNPNATPVPTSENTNNSATNNATANSISNTASTSTEANTGNAAPGENPQPEATVGSTPTSQDSNDTSDIEKQ